MDTDARVTTIALPELLFRRAKNETVASPECISVLFTLKYGTAIKPTSN